MDRRSRGGREKGQRVESWSDGEKLKLFRCLMALAPTNINGDAFLSQASKLLPKRTRYAIQSYLSKSLPAQIDQHLFYAEYRNDFSKLSKRQEMLLSVIMKDYPAFLTKMAKHKLRHKQSKARAVQSPGPNPSSFMPSTCSTPSAPRHSGYDIPSTSSAVSPGSCSVMIPEALRAMVETVCSNILLKMSCPDQKSEPKAEMYSSKDEPEDDNSKSPLSRASQNISDFSGDDASDDGEGNLEAKESSFVLDKGDFSDDSVSDHGEGNLEAEENLVVVDKGDLFDDGVSDHGEGNLEAEENLVVVDKGDLSDDGVSDHGEGNEVKVDSPGAEVKSDVLDEGDLSLLAHLEKLEDSGNIDKLFATTSYSAVIGTNTVIELFKDRSDLPYAAVKLDDRILIRHKSSLLQKNESTSVHTGNPSSQDRESKDIVKKDLLSRLEKSKQESFQLCITVPRDSAEEDIQLVKASGVGKRPISVFLLNNSFHDKEDSTKEHE